MEKINFVNKPNTDTPINDTNLNKMQDNIENEFKKYFKRLWNGTFNSGSITVDGISKYTIIGVYTSNSVMCIGTKSYGAGGFLQYGSTSNILFNAYRFNVSGDKLTIDENNKGATNGTSLISVVEIYGIF